MDNRSLRLAIPSKGRMAEDTLQLLKVRSMRGNEDVGKQLCTGVLCSDFKIGLDWDE